MFFAKFMFISINIYKSHLKRISLPTLDAANKNKIKRAKTCSKSCPCSAGHSMETSLGIYSHVILSVVGFVVNLIMKHQCR